jgi:hypothetical protein
MSESGISLRDRRVLVLLLVLLLALLGAGIGSFVFEGTDDQPGIQTPTANETLNVSLVADSDTRLVNASDVTPGTSGTRTVILRNSGEDSGTLSVAELSLTQRENGLVGPETDVDNTSDDGELADHLLVRVWFRTADGTTVSLYGTGDGARPLSAIVTENRSQTTVLQPGNRTRLVLEWELPADTGNVIQSDSLRLNATLQLRANGGA